MRSIAAAAFLALAGCATAPSYQWVHPHADQAQFARDVAQCEYEAAQASGSYSPNNRGYRTGIGQAIADQMDVNARLLSLGILCLKARGYTQQQLPI